MDDHRADQDSAEPGTLRDHSQREESRPKRLKTRNDRERDALVRQRSRPKRVAGRGAISQSPKNMAYFVVPDGFNPRDDQAIVRYGRYTFCFTHRDPKDHIFAILKSSGSFYESELLEKVSSLLSPGDIVADVGANIGTHSIFWAGVCQARVVAFEPDGESAALLRRNLELNQLSASVRVEQVGLGSKAGNAKVVQGPEHNRGMATLIVDANGPVKVCRLDDISLDGPVRVLKIDVEGMERQVLEGAVRTLERDHPVIAVEASDRAAFASVANFLRALDYKVVGTFNWTPTHLFVPRSNPSFKGVDGTVMESLALVRFEWTTLRDGVLSRLSSVDAKLNEQGQHLRASATVGVTTAGMTAKVAELAVGQSENSKRFGELQANLLGLDSRITDGMSVVRDQIGMLAQRHDTQTSLQLKVASLERELTLAVAQASQNKIAADMAGARAGALERDLTSLIEQNSEMKVGAEAAAARVAALDQQLADSIKRDAQATAAAEAAEAKVGLLKEQLSLAVARSVEAAGAAESAGARAETLQSDLAIALVRADEATAAARAAEQRAVALENDLSLSVARADEAIAAARAAEQRAAALENDLSLSVTRADEAIAAARAAEQRAEALESDLSLLVARADEAVAVGAAADARAAALERDLVATVIRGDHASAALKQATERAADLEAQLAVLVARDGQAKAAADVADARIFDLEGELSATRNRLSELGTRYDESLARDAEKIAVLEKEVLVYASALERQTSDSREAYEQVRSMQETLTAREAELALGTRRALELAEQMRETGTNNTDLLAKVARLEREREIHETTARSEADQLKKRIRALEARLAKVDGQLRTRQRELGSIKAEHERTRTLLYRFAGGVEAIATSRRWKIGDAFGSVTDRVLLRGKPTRVMDEMRGLLAEVRMIDAPATARAGSHVVEESERPRRSDADSLRDETPSSSGVVGCEAKQPLPKPDNATNQDPPRQEAAARSAPSSLGEDVTPTWYVRRVGQAVSSQAASVVPDPITIDSYLFRENYTSGWDGKGWANGPCDLLPGGEVRAREKAAIFGFVSRRIAFEGGGLAEIDVELSEMPHGVQPFLRVRLDDDTAVGPDVPLSQIRAQVRVFAPSRARYLKLYVLAVAANPGSVFRIRSIEMSRRDADQHAADVFRKVGQPVVASLASIPSRREMLRDCVASLLLQCDRVRVFLNNYDDVPLFLSHPRVEVRRSQDWDDRGDAGKMFWIDREQGQDGYRLIVDDDLVFQPDFAEVMCRKVKEHDNKAIFAAHGVLLRQPLVRYYDPASRAVTFHFSHALSADRHVHIGATNALCFHTSGVQMAWSDFRYCNSADVWLALYAQKNRLPILTPSRPSNWIAEGRHSDAGETIYRHSLNRTRSRFDSSLVQDAVLKHAGPLSIQVRERPKLGIAFVADDAALFSSAWKDFSDALSADAEWIVFIVVDQARADLADALKTLSIRHETHLTDSRGDAAAGIVSASRLAEELDVQFLYAVSNDVRFGRPPNSTTLLSSPVPGNVSLQAVVSPGDSVVHGLVFANGKVSPSNSAVQLSLITGARPGGGASDVFRRAADLVATHCGSVRSPKNKVGERVRVNDVFDRVLVLNLDRRPDRWLQAQTQLHKVGISAQRFSAVDGQDVKVRAEYAEYAAKPPHIVSPDIPPIRSNTDLYTRYVSQAQRIAYLEARDGGKAIRSPGAWGYLRSYEALIEQALTDRVDSLLVFDDDILLHDKLPELFAEAMTQVPDDWLILQLGTLQYNWSSSCVRWRAPMIYQTDGTAIGSHAVAMRFEALPLILDHVKRMDMPFDIGALSAVIRAFADRCFVVHPNLAIQRLTDSDIGTSEFLQKKGRDQALSTYRWTLSDYSDPVDAR